MRKILAALAQAGRALADWLSFQRGTVEGWIDGLCGREEDPLSRAIREDGERLRRAFPALDLDDPTPRSIHAEPASPGRTPRRTRGHGR